MIFLGFRCCSRERGFPSKKRKITMSCFYLWIIFLPILAGAFAQVWFTREPMFDGLDRAYYGVAEFLDDTLSGNHVNFEKGKIYSVTSEIYRQCISDPRVKIKNILIFHVIEFRKRQSHDRIPRASGVPRPHRDVPPKAQLPLALPVNAPRYDRRHAGVGRRQSRADRRDQSD